MNKRENKLENGRKIESKDVNKAVAHYLKLKHDEYLLDLSEEEALEMGISKHDFENVIEELENTNEQIKSFKAEPNHEVVLFDPETDASEERLQLPSGHLSSVGQEEVGASFFAPFNTSQVRFRCRGNAAPTPAFTCRTVAFGGEHQRTEVGTILYYTDIDVPIAASNTRVQVYFRTTDSNGGVCDWQAMY